MKIRTKLIALLLAIALIPAAIIGIAGLQNMQQIGDFAEDESTHQLETQITGELNSTTDARQEEFHNLLSAREIDANSLGESAPMENYHAASNGEMKLIQEQSQQQLGYISLQMLDSLESVKQQILDSQYDGQAWEDLSSSEQQAVKDEVERVIAGTAGNGTDPAGSFYDSFQPGYISDTGYIYFTDLDSNIVAHHSLPDGYHAADPLPVFEDIKSTIQSSPEIRNGEDWGVAEYDWEDTTQEGNPLEEKFISYTYYEDFDWIIAPNVYYYELQTTAVESSLADLQSSFETYLETRSIKTAEADRLAYSQVRFTDSNGDGVIRSYRTDGGEVQSEEIHDQNYADQPWFTEVSELDEGEVYFGDVHNENGKQVLGIHTPVYYNGEFAGVVSLAFNYDVISTISSQITVGESGYMSIVSEDGTVISHPEETVVSDGQNIGEESYAGGLASIADSQILDGERGLETYSRTENGEQRDYYVAFAPVSVGQKQFSVLATVPSEDVTAPIATLGAAMDDKTNGARNLFFIIFAVLGIVVIGSGYKTSQYFSSPIEAVRDRAMALSEGKLDQEVDTSSSRDDEIGELLDSFGNMQQNLRAVFADLDELSRNLESGQLDQNIQIDYPGRYGEIMANLETGSNQLRSSFREIRTASDSLRSGELDQQIDTNQPGEYGSVLGDIETGTNQLRESFDQILRVSEDLKAGKLDQDIQTDMPGAYGSALRDLESGIDGINSSIAQVQSIADTVATTSDEVKASTDEIESASQQVAESVQEISQGADEQSENLNEAANEMNDLSATVEEIASSATQVEGNANDAVAKGESGRERASEATKEINRIEQEAEASVQQVSSLDDEMEQIGEIVQMINDIAEQTNLLALNASIEAARAGEAGEGFAVVADEIKTLAGEASDATTQIEERIDEVQASTNETVEGIEGMKESVESGAETIEETIQLFDEIAAEITDVENGVREISDATDDQAASTEEVVAMVDEVTSVSEETAAEADNVSAAAEEQTSSLMGVGENVENLTNASKELHDLVEQFEVAGSRERRSGAQMAAATDGGSKADSTNVMEWQEDGK